jgi:hypothetical protein
MQEFSNSAIIRINLDSINFSPNGFKIPECTVWRKSELRFWPFEVPLNEFGYLYVALFIVGNYARYYPDKWLADVEDKTALGLAIEELVYIVEQRLALLSLSELTRIYYVQDD